MVSSKHAPYFALLLFIFAIPGRLVAELPTASLRVDRRAFSPNGDGYNDQLFFSPVLEGGSPVRRWRLDLKTERGKLVTRLSGPGLSALIPWDGRDRKGHVAPDGNYEAVFQAWSESGLREARRPVSIDTRIPTVTV